MHKKRIALALSAALLSAFVCADGASVATVNGVAIPQSKVDMLVKQVAARGQAADTPELRARIRESLIHDEIVVQEATKKGLDKDPEVLAQLEMAKTQILAEAFVKDYVKNHPIAEADLKKFYEEQVKPQFAGKEYHTRHILVATEAEAKTILAELKKGKKFDSLAKAKSIDKGSGENGGDLDWAKPEAFVKEFGDALQKLPKGKISAPVKTQFGYHIIKMEDVREAKGPSFEQVKSKIEQSLQNQALQKLVADLRAKAKVE